MAQPTTDDQPQVLPPAVASMTVLVAAVQVVGPRRRLEPATSEIVTVALRWGRRLEEALRGA